MILVLGKARSYRAPNMDCSGAESPGWFDVLSKRLCMRLDAWTGAWSWWSCPSPVAHSCDLLNHVNSFHRGMFKLNATFDADWLLYSVSHFECDGHTAHMLTQRRLPPPLTSTVKSSLFTHGHSSPLSLAARLHWCHANHFHIIRNFHHYRIIQSIFTALKIICALLIFFHPTSWAPGNHCSFTLSIVLPFTFGIK